MNYKKQLITEIVEDILQLYEEDVAVEEILQDLLFIIKELRDE